MKLKYTRTHIKDKSIVFQFVITIEEKEDEEENLSPLNETQRNQLKNTAQQKQTFLCTTSIRSSKREQRIECKISF